MRRWAHTQPTVAASGPPPPGAPVGAQPATAATVPPVAAASDAPACAQPAAPPAASQVLSEPAVQQSMLQLEADMHVGSADDDATAVEARLVGEPRALGDAGILRLQRVQFVMRSH